MDDLKFNIYGFVKPQTNEEISALIEEAVRVSDELNDIICTISEALKDIPPVD